MKKFYPILLLIGLLVNNHLYSQDLDQLLNDLPSDNSPNYIYGTFKGTTIINGQSVEIPGAQDLTFKISHRFGAVNLGLYEFFGIGQASTRFGFEYGLTENVSLSIGRNTYEKTYDGGIKYRILRQQTGQKNIPLTVTFYSAAFANTLKWEYPERDNLFSSRMSYASQILVARKFGQKFSFQLSPTYVHKNLVPTPKDQNNIFATGLGGRYKLSKKISMNVEYYYLFPGKSADTYSNSLSLGFDIQTGGHVFQLQFTNSRSMIENGFVTETSGEWLNGDIYFGFNLYRVFRLGNRRM